MLKASMVLYRLSVHDRPFEDDDNTVGELTDFVLFIRDDDDTQALTRQIAKQGVKLFLCAHVHATGRAESHDHIGALTKRAGENDLLLVAAAKLADRLFQRRRYNVGLARKSADMLSLFSAIDEPKTVRQKPQPTNRHILTNP